MLKIFTLFFCALITASYPSANASTASTGDGACAAAPRPKKSIIKSLGARTTGEEKPSILRRRGHVLKLKQSIIWPDDIDEEDRYYCVEKMIDLELNLWHKEPAPHRIPKIVVEALRNGLPLTSLTDGSQGYIPKKTGPAKMLALAIILDKNPTIDINKKFIDYYGDNKLILHFAVRDGTAPIIRMLCERGANMDAVENTSLNTALHMAALKCSIDAAQELIKQGASVTARNTDGWTALHVAAFYPRNLQTITLLLNHGANPYALTSSGLNVLNLARKNQEAACLSEGAPNPSLAAVIAYLEEFMATHPPEDYE